MVTVESLRQQGYRVRCLHKRYFGGYADGFVTRKEFCENEQEMYGDMAYSYNEAVLPYGGETVVEITTPEGVDLVGVAKCSIKDNYCKKKGVAIALGRAFKDR